MKNAFVFLESSLELVPKSIARHPSVIADARRRKKKPTEIILDDSKHHSAMRGLRNREKRGRPDILHQCLLLLLDSPSSADFDIYVHTINGKLIWINNEVRLPRNYNRFLGLMEDLFKKKVIVGEGKVLLKILDVKLKDVLRNRKVVLLDEKGEERDVVGLFSKNFAVCIGAFPHGTFSEKTLRSLGDFTAVRIGDRPYTSLYVTSRVLCIYEGIRVAEDRV